MECLRRLSKEPKSAFAFIHRAYNKDKKMAKQDLLRLGLEEAGGVVEWEEPEAEEDEANNGGTNRLLSIKGVLRNLFEWLLLHFCYHRVCRLYKYGCPGHSIHIINRIQEDT